MKAVIITYPLLGEKQAVFSRLTLLLFRLGLIILSLISSFLRKSMQLYNSLSGRKEAFQTRVPGAVSLYVCGVTVYDFCHIGHARTYAVFDTLVRFFRYQGLAVTYVRNITDIDDKIIKRAQERAQPCEKIVNDHIQAMYQDFDALHFLRPDVEPRATDIIPETLAFIETLIQKGFAYVSDNQDVYYEVSKFKSYGKLSKQNVEALQVGSRVEVNTHKKSPLDFVLWKAAKPGEPAWDSSWGKGRPGWHIECSSMTQKCLGPEFDIHGGGSDLRFPHHENEIAQSEAAHEGKFARYWMHTGMVQINAEKMSKSLDNFFLIRDVLQDYPAEVIRYFLMSGHYRSEISYSVENLESARAALFRLYRALEGWDGSAPLPSSEAQTRFMQALDDDLNTPEALAVLFDLVKEIHKTNQQSLRADLKSLAGILGLLQASPTAFLQGEPSLIDRAAIEAEIEKRNLARQAKHFSESDRIRDELRKQGIELEDQAEVTTWRSV